MARWAIVEEGSGPKDIIKVRICPREAVALQYTPGKRWVPIPNGYDIDTLHETHVVIGDVLVPK